MMPMMIDALNAALTGVISSVLLWMWCHRTEYNLRDFGIVGLLLISVLIRFTHPAPPPSHFMGIMLLNLIFVLVTALVWARPSKIPPNDRRNQCVLFKFLNTCYNKVRFA